MILNLWIWHQMKIIAKTEAFITLSLSLSLARKNNHLTRTKVSMQERNGKQRCVSLSVMLALKRARRADRNVVLISLISIGTTEHQYKNKKLNKIKKTNTNIELFFCPKKGPSYATV